MFLTRKKLECVHQLMNETNDTRNERYTKRTIRETNEPITQTKRKRTENEKQTNDTRKRYEISVNLNDPGSVIRINAKVKH